MPYRHTRHWQCRRCYQRAYAHEFRFARCGDCRQRGRSIKNTLADTVSANNLNSSLRRLAHTLVVSLQDSLLTPQTRKHLDSAVTELLDTLSSPHNQHNINVLIANVGHQLNLVLDTLLGPARGQQISDLINKYILGDTTTKNLLHLRDTLLGSQLDSLVARLVDTLTYGIKNQLTPAIDTALAQTNKDVKRHRAGFSGRSVA